MLKMVWAAAFVVLPLAAVAADKSEKTAMTPQQQKMAACNKDAGAKNLAGDERKKFMSDCLSADTPMTQQDKMAYCNKEAGAKKLAGDERKKFMSNCLSADGGKPMTQQDKMTSCNKQAGDKKLAGDARKKFMSDCLSG